MIESSSSFAGSYCQRFFNRIVTSPIICDSVVSSIPDGVPIESHTDVPDWSYVIGIPSSNLGALPH